jgi:hypothetical protein
MARVIEEARLYMYYYHYHFFFSMKKVWGIICLNPQAKLRGVPTKFRIQSLSIAGVRKPKSFWHHI